MPGDPVKKIEFSDGVPGREKMTDMYEYVCICMNMYEYVGICMNTYEYV